MGTQIERIVLAALAAVPFTGCATASPPPPSTPAWAITPGLVQRDVTTGMSAADVAAVLGSPNIVTRDGSGQEVWIYDRVSTEVVETRLHAWVGALGPVGGWMGASGGSAADHRVVSSQRTLTVLVRFDVAARVADVRLHATRF